MKHYLFFLFIFQFSVCCFGQSWQYQLQDDYFNWFYKHQMQFKVGDELPDFKNFGIYLNEAEYVGTPGKKVDNKVEGKLIIFDFWNTWCSDCIAKFPKMEEIQKKYNDQIQIFLVNSWETKAEILKKNFGPDKSDQPIKLPDLPSIVDVSAMRLFNLFPSRGVPAHVWIDKDRIVRLIGPAENTYGQKIEELLNGKCINYLTHNATTPEFNTSYPYYKILGREIVPGKLNFFITKFNNEYASRGSQFIEGVIDSVSHTVRDTYINMTLLEILEKLFSNSLKENISNTIYQNTMSIPYCILDVKDTLRYTHRFVPYLELTDEQYTKSRICYEQVLPINASKECRRNYMLDQCSKYFDSLYGMKLKLVKLKTRCHVLLKTSGIDKIKSISEKLTIESFMQNSIEMTYYKGFASIKDALRTALGKIDGLQSNSQRIMLWDESHYTGKVDIALPKKLSSIEELRKALRPYDLDIFEAQREIEYLVITETTSR
jgi:thiol-disulfide isomerase/thioredoxin